MKIVEPQLEFYKDKLSGKRVFIFSGGPKSYHLSKPLEEELGMETVAVASQFEHKDGYEKMKSRVKEGTLILDDPNSLEFEESINEYKPDLILAGVKEKYLAHKLGVPCILIHSYENGPYMGFEGFVNLAKDMYSNIYSPVWKMVEYKDESVEDTYNMESENNSETEKHDNRAKNAEEMA